MDTRYHTIQEWLITYLAKVLNIDADDIATSTPFSRYGLDSMASVVMIGDLMEWLGRQIELDAIYRHPTVDSLARFLSDSTDDERVET